MTNFPDSLKSVIISDTILEDEREELIRSADQETKRVALDWLQKHPLALQTSHRLRRVHQLLQEERSDCAAPGVFALAFGARPLSAWVYNPLAPLEKFIEDPQQRHQDHLYEPLIRCVTTNKKAIPALLNCCSSGAISFDDLTGLLVSCCMGRKGLAFLQLVEGCIGDFDGEELEVLFAWVTSEGVFSDIKKRFLSFALPELFDKIPFEKVQNLLSDRRRAVLFYDKDMFCNFLQAAYEKLTFEQLHALLNTRIYLGSSPLSSHENFSFFLKFAKNHLTFEQLKACLSIPDVYGISHLCDSEKLQSFLEIGGSFLTKEKVKEFLLTSGTISFTPLHMELSIDIAIQLKELFSPEERIALLRTKSAEGATVLHGKILPVIAALLEGIPKEEARLLLHEKNDGGQTFFHHLQAGDLQRDLRGFLEGNKELITPEELQDFIAMSDEDGKTPLHYQGHLQSFLELDEDYLSFERLKELVLTRDRDGNTPLHDQSNAHAFLQFAVNKLSPEELQAALSVQNEEGKTPLHKMWLSQSDAFELADMLDHEARSALFEIVDKKNETPLHGQSLPAIAALLRGIPEEEALRLLRVVDSEGRAVLSDPLYEKHFTRDVNPIQLKASLERLAPSVKGELLSVFFFLVSVRNEDGKTPLHNHRRLPSLLPLLEEFSEDAVKELFSLQDHKGNTPLHYFPNPEEIAPLLHKLVGGVLNIKNHEGISAISSFNLKPSVDWLIKPKPIVAQEALSEEEYEARARKVREDLLALWESLSFGEEGGKVPENYLEAEIKSTLRSCTPDQVRQAFSVMLGRIVEEEAWLGTPPAEQAEQIHAFYTPMLLNLEKIVQKLREKEDPVETAGVLFSLAKVQLEGRCAAAYQGEIEQAAALISGMELELTTDAFLGKCAKNTLVEVIENTLRNMGSSSTNVHVYNQFAYVAGLFSAPDPLSYFSAESCRTKLEKAWSFSSILPRLALQFRKIPAEQMIDWLKEKTPESFDGGYLPLKEGAQIQEQEILRSTRERLLEIGIDEEKINRILSFFSSPAGASLSPIATAKTRDELKSAFAQAIKETFPIIELREGLLEEHIPQTLDEQSLLAAFTSIRRAVSIDKKDFLRWKNTTDAFTQSLLNKERIGEESFMEGLSWNIQNAILQIKQEYDRQIKSIAEEIEERIEEEIPLFIKLKECGLPSKGIENSRKMAFAASLFEAARESQEGAEERVSQQLSLEGAAFAALQIEVFEEPLRGLA